MCSRPSVSLGFSAQGPGSFFGKGRKRPEASLPAVALGLAACGPQASVCPRGDPEPAVLQSAQAPPGALPSAEGLTVQGQGRGSMEATRQ